MARRTPRKSDDSDYKPVSLKPLTSGQREYIRNVAYHMYNIAAGPAGTGKTHVAVGMAVQLMRQEEIEQIIITRPLVGVGRDMGYLPGDIDQKVSPYVVPCFDEFNYYLSLRAIGDWKREGKIKIVPLTMMRGRTFRDSFVILDEAQNALYCELKTCLTRMGENSKIVITGDPDQSDLPSQDRGGLTDVMTKLHGMKDYVLSSLTSKDIVRSDGTRDILERL